MKLLKSALVVTLLILSTSANSAILKSYSVNPNSDSQTVNFSLTFDVVPDFNTYDAFGRQSDGFWIDILNNPVRFKNVINGFGGEDIRIVSGYLGTFVGYTSSEFNGFFATTTPRFELSQFIEKIPYQLTGTTVAFTTTFAQLGENDGVFEAVLVTINYGSSGISNHISGTNISPVPIPAAAWLFGSGLIGLAGFARRR